MPTQRMDGFDSLLWAIEGDPQLGSRIVGVVVLDGTPDLAAVQQRLAEISRGIPPLRATPGERPYPLGLPRWQQRDQVDVSRHVSRASARSRRGGLASHIEELGNTPTDASEPMWHVRLVEDLGGGRSALLARLHHSIADGLGAMIIAGHFFDADERGTRLLPSPEPPEAQVDTGRDGSVPPIATALAEDMAAGRSLARRLLSAAARSARNATSNPQDFSVDVATNLASFARVMAPATEPLSPLLTTRSGQARRAWFEVSLEDLRRSARRVEGSINDAYAAGLLAGIQRYHAASGQRVEALRVGMPVNYRPAEDANPGGNHFAAVRIAVPLTTTEPLELMGTVKQHLRTARREPALRLTPEITQVLGRLPAGVARSVVSGMYRSTDVMVSNVPGPTEPLWCAGRRVEALYAAGPLSGTAVGSTMVSYRGTAHVMVGMDTAAVADPELMARCIQEGFDAVVSLGETHLRAVPA